MPIAPSSLVLLLIGLFHAGIWGVLFINLAYIRRQQEFPVDSLPSLTVCVPARNEADNLRRLLPTLQAQDYPDLEILVWDDASSDDTWDVLEDVEDSRLRTFRGEGPPDGWMGKVHALYQCSRRATGEAYVFLDADAELQGPDALRRLVTRHLLASSAVTSGLPHIRGGGLLLVSLVPHLMLRSLPWPLISRTESVEISALNGQCWVIDADIYHEYEPHAAVNDEILEDVAIGRYLKRHGHPPSLLDLQDLVAVYMYEDFASAWRGFRKNAYLLLGGSVLRFSVSVALYATAWLIAPFLSTWFLASLYGLKFVTDHASGMPLSVTALAPVSYLLGFLLQFDSALHHWIDRVHWKGRSVSGSPRAPSLSNEDPGDPSSPPR